MRKARLGTMLSCLGMALIVAALGLLIHNTRADASAGQTAADLLSAVQAKLPETSPADKTSGANSVYPDAEMPTLEIDGNTYIGTVSIPALELSLPVLTAWDAQLSKIAPCRYQGSAYNGTLIIAGHNYDSHFGRLKLLTIGDAVVFTDVDGNVFTYEVTDTEIIGKYDVDRMSQGDWDLTLFTCTIGGLKRVTVRCTLVA